MNMTVMQTAPPGATWGIWLRCPTNSGGKDWVGFQTPGGQYHARWGKTGQICQEKIVTGNLHRKISGKLAKGYSAVADWNPGVGWVSASTAQKQTAPQPVLPKPAPTPAAKVNWATEINNPESPTWF